MGMVHQSLRACLVSACMRAMRAWTASAFILIWSSPTFAADVSFVEVTESTGIEFVHNSGLEGHLWTLEITGSDGITRSGFRMGEDSFSVRIMDNDSNLWSYQKSDIISIERIERSTMPSYDGSMAENELDDLVAYLFSLRREEN